MKKTMESYLRGMKLPYTPDELGYRVTYPSMFAARSFEIYLTTDPKNPIVTLDENRNGELTVHGYGR